MPAQVRSIQKSSDNSKRQTRVAKVKDGKRPLTLAVDIGGTGIKARTLDTSGSPVNERARIATPRNATPKKVIAIIRKLAKQQGPFDRVSIGFPGVTKGGVIYSAPNLGKGWKGFDLESAVKKKLDCGVRIANDADVQGLGAVSGNGLELVITLGTGFGSVLFVDGHRIHLELAHHPFHRGKTYEHELGRAALDKRGKKKWNKMLTEALDDLSHAFNYDRLYIGGGNTRYIKIDLPPKVKIVSNEDGLLGGIRLWEEPHGPGIDSASADAVSAS